MTTERFEEIEKYLDGSLSESALADFEARLATDEQLQADVRFQRNLETTLAHQRADDLRQTINKIHDEKRRPKRSIKTILLAALALVALGLFAWLYREMRQPASPPRHMEEERQHPASASEPTIDTTQTKEDIPAVTPPPAIPSQQKQTPSPSTEKPLLMAANFEPNSYLEKRLSSLRSGTMDVKAFEESYTRQEGAIDFRWQAENKADNETGLSLHIFTNKLADYESFRPIYTTTLDATPADETTELLAQASLTLDPGLYYIQVEDADGEILYLNKFIVRE